jgi:hypothetical protein
VLERYDERQARESTFTGHGWPQAHVQAGDVEHATALAQRTLELSALTSSSRGDDRATLLAQRLADRLHFYPGDFFIDELPTADALIL